MEISKRLMAVAGLVKTDGCLADIGTDHGYIPIYLCKTGAIKKGIACDINRGPLERACANIHAYNCDEKIELRLGSGLSPIKKGEADTAVMAGMGGRLIIDILDSSLEITKSLKELVLQPQLDIMPVRKYIHSIGFTIDDEDMVYEDGKYYTIIRAVPGVEKYNDEKDYIFGKKLIDKRHLVLKSYIEYILNKYEAVLSGLEKLSEENLVERKNELSNMIKDCREVHSCL